MSLRNKLFTGTRLWTCDPETRSLILEGPDAVKGALIQHARTADSVIEVKAEGDDKKKGSRIRRFRITTETTDRHGDVVRTRGGQLKNYRKNPVVLFAHDAGSPPIGKGKVDKGEGFMDADVDFFDRDTFEFADTIFRIVNAGGLKATSIGFMPLEFDRLSSEDGEKLNGIDFKKWDLLEFSIVPIPANPEAVGRALKDGAAMRPYLEWLDSVQDNWDETKHLLAAFDVNEEALTATRKAASAEKTSVQISSFVSRETQDDILQRNLAAQKKGKEVEAQTEEQEETTEEFGELTFSKTDAGVVTCENDPPKRTKISLDVIELSLGLADPKIERVGDLISIETDDIEINYTVDEEDKDAKVVSCTLLGFERKAPISYKEAHPSGTPKQEKDAGWNGAREVNAASVKDLLIMSAWRADKEKDDLVKADFRFAHHKASSEHATNFRACVAGIASLNGARGGSDIPANERRGVWAHLAQHISNDFNETVPELRWVSIEPLKNHPETFVFDYDACQLLAWKDGVLIDAKHIELMARRDDKSPVTLSLKDDDAAKKEALHVQEVAGRKQSWQSLDAFIAWAKERGFKTDDINTTKNYWRLEQRKAENFDGTRTLCINPSDELPGSAGIKVLATVGTLKEEEKDETLDKLAADKNPVKVLAGMVRSIAEEAGLDVDEDAIKAAEEYAAQPVSLATVMLSAFVSGACLQQRAMQVANGVFGKDLTEADSLRLCDTKRFFMIENGNGENMLDADIEEHIEEGLVSGACKFARSYHDQSTGHIKVRGMDVDTLQEAEESTREFLELNQDPDQVVFLAVAVGQMDDEPVYQDEVALRYVPERGVVRLGLGKRVSDPLDHLDVLARSLGEEARTYTDEEEQKLTDVVALLSTILDDIAESKGAGEEDEAGDDFDLAKLFGLDEPTKEQTSEKKSGETTKDEEGEYDFLKDVTEEDFSELVGDILSEEAPKATAAALEDAMSKLTGALD